MTRILAAEDVEWHREALAALLADAIADGASVGYLWPADPALLARFWADVAADVATGDRTCFAAFEGDLPVGVVLLAPCRKPNQPHRAEVQKLLVLRARRSRGIAASLMRTLEAHALAVGRTLLTLDTRSGSVADARYRGWGWTPHGVVPGYARDPDGVLASCTFFYKWLVPAPGSRS